jgi:hypothetical protein
VKHATLYDSYDEDEPKNASLTPQYNLPITPPGFRPGKPEYIHGSKLEPVPFFFSTGFSQNMPIGFKFS